MAAQELEGDNLGQRHRAYNTIIQELTTTNTSPDGKFADSDIEMLLKIDVASRNKNVEYILEVLKGDDLLYVSKALSSATWLITDPDYANIINPEYLESNLYPKMTTKAATKLKKHIRHNIKDETRAEQFYLSEKNKSESIKWLPYCSVKFIENNIGSHIEPMSKSIEHRLFKRLCEKSITIFEVIIDKVQDYQRQEYAQAVTFLLYADIDKYLNILEKYDGTFGYRFKFNRHATAFILKHAPTRVTDKIEKYVNSIHLPTFVEYLPSDQIKSFLIAQASNDLTDHKFTSLRLLFKFDNLALFIKRLPKNEQLDFVKTICTGTEIKEGDEEILSSDTGTVRLMKLCCAGRRRNSYEWYRFASFEIAFEELSKLYPVSANNNEKHDILSILIKCAGHNMQHIRDILQFYNKQTKEDSDGKCRVVTMILKQTNISKFDQKTWNMLNDLLISAKIYEESNNCGGYSEIINSIVIYNALNGLEIPKLIENKFPFGNLKSYKSKMDQQQQDKVFSYLYNYLVSKFKESVTNEDEFKELIENLENVLKLMKDWEKSFLGFPLILNKIRELITLKKKNTWKTDLSALYNVNKKWRKHMFEESVDLWPSEEVCLNALKHEPQLLTRHSDQVDTLRTNDAASLRRLLRKLRIYWPYSLAQQWIDTYVNNIDKSTGQKAAVKGLCIMLAQKPLLDMIEKYKPINAKIDWKQIEDNVLDVQRLLAKNMHISRPQPIPDAILAYAKGDYLQFALPSLLAIFYNLRLATNKEYIPRLLDAPVSLQKHGIRLAFKKLEREELKKIFLDCWKSSKNVSIRAIIFKYTFTLLSNEKDDANALSLWELLELFIDNLTFTEDKETYKLLGEVDQVPINVRARFIEKSYNFVQKLMPKVDESNRSTYRWICYKLAESTRAVMDTMNLDFVLAILQDFIENDFFKYDSKFVRSVHYADGMTTVFSAYLLCVSNENDQMQRYEQVFVPLMQRSFEKWDEKRDRRYVIRNNFQQLLIRLAIDLKAYVTENKKIIPLKIFSLIQTELENTLKVSENYLLLTKWKLTVALASLAAKYSSTDELWYDKCGAEFGKMCLDYLKSDVTAHFPCIYVLFSKTIRVLLSDILSEDAIFQFYESILSDKDFIQGYLAIIDICSDYRHDDRYKKINQIIGAHPSVEVKMHYYNKIEKPKV